MIIFIHIEFIIYFIYLLTTFYIYWPYFIKMFYNLFLWVIIRSFNAVTTFTLLGSVNINWLFLKNLFLKISEWVYLNSRKNCLWRLTVGSFSFILTVQNYARCLFKKKNKNQIFQMLFWLLSDYSLEQKRFVFFDSR